MRSRPKACSCRSAHRQRGAVGPGVWLESERPYRDFAELTPYWFQPLVRTFKSWIRAVAPCPDEPLVPITASCACGLLNRHRATARRRVAANLHGSVRATRGRHSCRATAATWSACGGPGRVALRARAGADPWRNRHNPVTLVGDDPRVDAYDCLTVTPDNASDANRPPCAGIRFRTGVGRPDCSSRLAGRLIRPTLKR
jgi:hypothetical protein